MGNTKTPKNIHVVVGLTQPGRLGPGPSSFWTGQVWPYEGFGLASPVKTKYKIPLMLK